MNPRVSKVTLFQNIFFLRKSRTALVNKGFYSEIPPVPVQTADL